MRFKVTLDIEYTALNPLIQALAPLFPQGVKLRQITPYATTEQKKEMPDVAYISAGAAYDVAYFLERMIPYHCPTQDVKAWEEVRDALYAIQNDTDAIVIRETDPCPYTTDDDERIRTVL